MSSLTSKAIKSFVNKGEATDVAFALFSAVPINFLRPLFLENMLHELMHTLIPYLCSYIQRCLINYLGKIVYNGSLQSEPTLSLLSAVFNG